MAIVLRAALSRHFALSLNHVCAVYVGPFTPLVRSEALNTHFLSEFLLYSAWINSFVFPWNLLGIVRVQDMVGLEVLQWNLGMLCLKIWLVGVLGQWESPAICCSPVVRKRVFRSNYGDNFFTCFLHTLAVDGPYSLESAGLVLNCPDNLVMLALLPLLSISLISCFAWLHYFPGYFRVFNTNPFHPNLCI